jgi:hypothetical protein
MIPSRSARDLSRCLTVANLWRRWTLDPQTQSNCRGFMTRVQRVMPPKYSKDGPFVRSPGDAGPRAR